ncbi:hypothetical protein KP509_02G049700 [Ceratopteris richardii]|uniref:Pentatricopeptide repeat-containing protein n=1 Tax=Ceratopteris richardii TaxID=49495 RepID=A0A8T2V5N3_CERRI|nr:hypothetical protein KP509_02G049700 [Ceratopteris richardii]
MFYFRVSTMQASRAKQQNGILHGVMLDMVQQHSAEEKRPTSLQGNPSSAKDFGSLSVEFAVGVPDKVLSKVNPSGHGGTSVHNTDKVSPMGEHRFVDRTALFSLIKTCGKHKDLQRGSTVHTDVLERGLLKNDVGLFNALLSMYMKCGAPLKAQKMFDEQLMRNVVSWNALITGYVQQGLSDKALGCYEQMLDEGLSPNAVTFLCILKACGNTKDLDKGEAIHAEIGRQGLTEKDLVLGTALVDMYAKCGALHKAQSVFDSFNLQDTVMWNALLSGYAQNGLGHKVLSYYEQMKSKKIRPDSVTYIAVLKACGSIGALKKGTEIHHELRGQGLLYKDIMVGTALVDMYAKCGALVEAKGAFNELPAPNVATWNALIAGYAHKGMGKEALTCFEQMQDDGITPDMVTFVCTITACGSIRALEKGKEIHKEADRQGLLEKDNVLGNALIDMYAKCGSLDKAQETLDKLRKRDVATWTALIAGYVQHGLDDEALSCYARMREEGVHPDDVTFGCILRACGNLGAVLTGEAIHAEVGLQERDSVLGTALVDMYAKCGLLGKAQAVFDKLLVQSIAAWTALITGYGQIGWTEKVIDVFSKMTEEGIEPNLVTFIVLLTACSHAGLVDEGQMYFEKMISMYCIHPTSEHYTCIVDTLSRAGQFNMAICIIQTVPQADHLLLWSVMMGACRKWSDVELGKQVFEHAIMLDEERRAAYICLDHLYSASDL